MATTPGKEDRKASKTSDSKVIPPSASMVMKAEGGRGSTGRRTSSWTASGHFLAR